MDCPECGRNMGEGVQPTWAAEQGDDDILSYFCEMCDTHHNFDHSEEGWVEESE